MKTTQTRAKRAFFWTKMTGAVGFLLAFGSFFTASADVFADESANKNPPPASFSHPMPAETNQAPLLPTLEEMASTFANPVEKVRTGAYWYWLSGNVTSEGVAKDVRAMKSIGIDRAYIGDIGVDGLERGAVRTFSPSWWDAIHTALKTATENNVEIGIFNSPGWSQSGGPWVDSTRAMRYLTGETLEVSGPGKATIKLKNRSDEFQDVRVLAFPKPRDAILTFDVGADGWTVNKKPSSQAITLADDNAKPLPFTARSLTIQTKETPVDGTGFLEAKIDGEFKKIVDFAISRYNPELNVGFAPYAPVVVSFPAVTSNEFRLTVQGDRDGAGIASAYLTSAPRIASYPEKTLAKLHQTPHPMWTEYQWPPEAEVDAAETMIDPKGMIDLTEKIKADRSLDWDVPAGEWTVFWTGMVPTGTKNAPAVPEATGYETDKMSRRHINYHFDSMMGEILRKIPEADRKSFKVVVQDSYEVGGQNFTDDFIPEFTKRFGYDPTPFLPAWFGYVVGTPDESDRFLWDLRRFVADEIAYSYVGGLREAGNAHGLTTWLECYGHWGFPGEFLKYGGQSDEIAGEYWSEGTLGDIENRIASSCGHIYGKRQIWAESNTCAGNPFSRSPIDMKVRTDLFFSEGINQSLLHLYVQQPDERVPGFNAWFGNEFNRHNTWFTQLDLFTTYLKRVNYLLQQGTNVADVAYFIGEDAPKMTGAVDPPLPSGFQYDFINAEVLEESAFVRDGNLTLPHGTSYRVLVLPKLETMRPELLRKIATLVEDGAVVLGPKPNRSPSLQNQPAADGEVRQLADELWGNVDGEKVKSRSVGKGLIASGMTLDELFARLGIVSDCHFDAELPLVYGHRTLKNAEIYFLANQSAEPISSASVQFRVAGKTPRVWFPTTGEIRALSGWKRDGGLTTVPLSMAARESFFVLFDETADTASGKSGDSFAEGDKIATLEGAWSVTFDSGEIARGPKSPVKFVTLSDWTKSDDPAIKFYSGAARYEKTFALAELPQGKRIVLSLGKVAEMAKVRINGQNAGGVWTDPYELDVTKWVRAGENKIEVEVVNTWVNRLVGDATLPEAERKTWAAVNPYKADSPLKASGLMGPVVIRAK